MNHPPRFPGLAVLARPRFPSLGDRNVLRLFKLVALAGIFLIATCTPRAYGQEEDPEYGRMMVAPVPRVSRGHLVG